MIFKLLIYLSLGLIVSMLIQKPWEKPSLVIVLLWPIIVSIVIFAKLMFFALNIVDELFSSDKET